MRIGSEREGNVYDVVDGFPGSVDRLAWLAGWLALVTNFQVV